MVGVSAARRAVKHVAHVIEGLLVVLVAVVGHQGIGRLLGGHLVGRLASVMAEAAVLQPIAQQIRQYTDVVLDEFFVATGILVQGGQGHNDLSAGLRATVPAGAVLRGRQEIQSFLYSVL